MPPGPRSRTSDLLAEWPLLLLGLALLVLLGGIAVGRRLLVRESAVEVRPVAGVVVGPRVRAVSPAHEGMRIVPHADPGRRVLTMVGLEDGEVIAMTTVAKLLGDDVGRGLNAELERVVANNGGLASPLSGLLRRRAAEAVAAVLDIDLGTLALDGWAKYDRLHDAARRSSEPGAEPERVRLVEHQIISTHAPALEIYVNGALLATINLGLEVEINVHGLDAEIRSARLTALRTGDVDVRATLSFEGSAVVERERSYDVGALLPLNSGVPLTGTGSGPTSLRTPRRRVRMRGCDLVRRLAGPQTQ